MAEFTDADRKTLTEIHQILCGNGIKGLCQRFDDCQKDEADFRKEHTQEDNKFRKEFYHFRTWMIAVISITSGSAGFGLTKFFGG